MKYKYVFECEYTKTTLKPFRKVVEYDHEPTEDELQDYYNDWVSNYIVGGWERGEDGRE